MSQTSYPISVVLPTTQGWPGLRPTVESILPQLRTAGGQLVVSDSSGRPPPALAGEDDVLWLERPNRSVFDQRREAYDAAAGAIVAVTEDHCTVADDWLERILAAHGAAADALAIGGAVENGTTDHPSDWALYLIGHVRWAPPLPPEPDIIVGHSNISYKRRALELMPARGPQAIEILFHQFLRRRGHRVLVDDRIRVRHHQCLGAAELARLQFHNGRAIAGLRREAMSGADWLRLSAPAALAGYRLARTMRLALGKPLPRGALLRSVPYLALGQLSHALGEAVGYIRGQGRSAIQLH